MLVGPKRDLVEGVRSNKCIVNIEKVNSAWSIEGLENRSCQRWVGACISRARDLVGVLISLVYSIQEQNFTTLASELELSWGWSSYNGSPHTEVNKASTIGRKVAEMVRIWEESLGLEVNLGPHNSDPL